MMNKKSFSLSLVTLFLMVLILSLFSYATARDVLAATLVDTLVMDLREQVKKNCPEKTGLAKTKEQEFGVCVQTKFTPCAATRPSDPLSCADPAATQCRSIIDVFLTTCGAVASPCPKNEELKDGACVCKHGYDRVDGICVETVGGNSAGIEVVEYRVMKMTVKSMSGDIRIQHRGKWDTEAKDNEEITEGDEIIAGFDSHVVLATDRGDVILLKTGAQIRIATKNERKFEIKLEKGEIKFEIKPLTYPTRPDVRIVSPTVTASVRGTTFIMRAMETGISEVLVSDGTVLVTNNKTGKESTVSAGQKLTATTDDLSTPEPLTIQDKNLFADGTALKNNRNLLYGIAAAGILALIGALIFLVKRKGR